MVRRRESLESEASQWRVNFPTLSDKQWVWSSWACCPIRDYGKTDYSRTLKASDRVGWSVDILQRWQVWKDGLKASQSIAVPRWYGFHHHECQSLQLHLFCDASEIAYGAVAYFRTVTCGPVNVSFVISKTRLAPIKTLTIPCLELQAAVVAARLKTKILEEINFEVDETHFWSDSKIVVHYLSNTQTRFNMYVSQNCWNRLQIRRQGVGSHSWHNECSIFV